MKRIVIILCLLLVLTGCEEKPIEKINIDSINIINENDAKTFDFEINSRGYILMRLNDLNVLYKSNTSEKIYPASLTKILTLDTILNLCDDLNETSSVSSSQMADLISQDASIAYLKVDKQYTLQELLYALVLPSGADAALALDNYLNEKGYDLVEQMNIQASSLGCSNSHFTNSTGLHDDNHYTSLDDLFTITLDCLKYEQGREILQTMSYENSDGETYKSTLKYIAGCNVDVLGGKTGFTTVAGQLIMVFYNKDNRSYLLMLSNAPGNSYIDQFLHYEDCINIFGRLYD